MSRSGTGEGGEVCRYAHVLGIRMRLAESALWGDVAGHIVSCIESGAMQNARPGVLRGALPFSVSGHIIGDNGTY